MTDCNSNPRSHSPHSSLSTPTPISVNIAHGAQEGSNTTAKQVAVADSSNADQTRESLQKSDVATSPRNVGLQTPRSNSSQSLARSRRRNIAGAPKASGSARPSRSSRAPAGSSDLSSLPNEKSKHDNTHPDSHSTPPDSHGPPVVNTHTPLSPCRTKARRRSTAEGSSITSNMPNTSSLASPAYQTHAKDVHEDIEAYRHPVVENEPGFGTEGHSTDSAKTGSESSATGTEAESLASSILSEPGDSVPEELASSECSNPAELCLDSQGVGDSVTSINVVAQIGEHVNQNAECSGILAVSPHSANVQCSGAPDSVSQQIQASSVLIPTPSLKQPASVSSRPVSHMEDDTGWITNQQSSDKPSEAQSNQQPDVNSREREPPIDLEKVSNPVRSSEAHTSIANETARGREASWLQSTPRGLRILQGSQEQTIRSPRLVPELKPTCADFVPRATNEPGPVLVGTEYKPPQTGFISDPSLADYRLGDTARVNDAFKGPVSVVTSQATSKEYAPSGLHPFHPDRATTLNEYQSQTGNNNHLDDALYLDKMQSRVPHSDTYHSFNEHLVADEQFHQADGSQSDQPYDDSHKTPNVYINGLPPHFPEDQLYALAAPFGEVKSVRTFTRHVKDSESGYGFVLFDTIEAAERCILALRKYRNLHPTFSKQIHKIPGTIYAHAQSNSESTSSLGSWDPKQDEKESFKRRMESLHDPTSTNLYMEGLPLSTDEATLAALVAPHRISSSRLFQTKLSNPPRIIAFVRLETRAGAEEVIERLHGRMVRGWNDTGSRISVRFADTAEQRELRRSERAAKEGDNSTSKLTIAQAALLNRCGPELGQMSCIANVPVIGEHRQQSPASFPQNEFYSNPISNAQMTRPFEVDYSLASSRIAGAQQFALSAGDFGRNSTSQLPRSIPRNVDPSAAIFVNPLHSNGAPFPGTSPSFCDPYTRQPALELHNQRHMSNSARPSPAQARAGYTPVEELIMRVHAESARSRPAALDFATHSNNREAEALNTGVRVHFKPTATATLGQYSHPSLSDIRPVSATGENEFHGNTARPQREQAIADHDADATMHIRSHRRNDNQDTYANPRNARDSYTSASSQHRFDPSISSVVNDQCLRQHVRCTTFPYRPASGSTSGNHHQRHQQHNSMSLPNTSRRTPQHPSMAVMGQNAIMNSHFDYSDSIAWRETKNKNQSQFQQSTGASPACQTYDSEQNPTPQLISPTLTYTSQTPSTLSPATPFFGSFSSQNEGFERLSMNVSGFERDKGKSVAP